MHPVNLKEVLGLPGSINSVREMPLKAARWKRSHMPVNICLLSTYCILGTVLTATDPVVTRQKFISYIVKVGRRQTIKTKVNNSRCYHTI